LDRYQTFISQREELSRFTDKLEFVTENNINFKEFDGVVIARTPERQLALVADNLDFDGHIFLEKPLGVSSETHDYLIDLLAKHDLNFSVAYLFRYLDWYREAINVKGENSSIKIDWEIPKLSEDSWKSDLRSGGGLASYYGVHLVSMLVEFGGSPKLIDITQSRTALIISGEVNSTLVRFKISYSNKPGFNVEVSDHSGFRSWEMLSPFGPVPSEGFEDPRVPAISDYFKNMATTDTVSTNIIHERKVIEFRRILEGLM
jgi:hypothetical protein